jgi:hypothetical protein
VSVGSGLGRAALGWTRDAAATILAVGSFEPLDGAVPFGDLGALLERRL